MTTGRINQVTTIATKARTRLQSEHLSGLGVFVDRSLFWDYNMWKRSATSGAGILATQKPVTQSFHIPRTHRFQAPCTLAFGETRGSKCLRWRLPVTDWTRMWWSVTVDPRLVNCFNSIDHGQVVHTLQPPASAER